MIELAPSLVLVDFDDTIVDTGPRFQNARRALIATLRDAGFPEDVAHDVHYNQVDPVMRKEYGLGPRRMGPSFVATYERLVRMHGVERDQVIADRCAEFGRSCFGPAPAFEGALDALKRLSHALPTVIYTQSGDMEYQLSCVRGSGVIDIVREDRVHVLERKDAAKFRETLDHYGVADPLSAWMIGNSMRSDINPALEAGANAILIETADPWEYDLVDPHSPHFHRIPTFTAAVDYLIS